jgi:beta-glucosidase
MMKNRMTRIVAGFVACTGTLFFGSILQSAVAQDTANLPYMNTNLSPEQRAIDLVHRMTLAEKATQMYNNSAAIPRLNVPAYQWWSEALGIHTMATQIGIEGRIKHVQDTKSGHVGIGGGLDFWSPNLNIFRDPRWGRGQETYGEDPFLTGRMGVAYVT